MEHVQLLLMPNHGQSEAKIARNAAVLKFSILHKKGPGKLTALLSAFRPNVMLAWYQQAGRWRKAETTLTLSESGAVILPWPSKKYFSLHEMVETILRQSCSIQFHHLLRLILGKTIYHILSSIVRTFLHWKWCWNIPCTLYMEGSRERVLRWLLWWINLQ